MILPKKLVGDCRETLKSLPPGSVQTTICSPPYFGLRSYLPKDHPLKPLEIGSEATIELYIDHLLEVFREVRRVLRDDGTLWCNVGDSYNAGTTAKRKPNPNAEHGYWLNGGSFLDSRVNSSSEGFKVKDLMMMPSRVAMALQADGWYLRAMCPWLKRNSMPESCVDRPAVAVEYIFLFSKSPRYYYDRLAVMQNSSDNTHPRVGRDGSFTGNRAVDQMRSDAAMEFPGRANRDDQRRRGITPKSRGSGTGNKNNDSFAAGCSQYVVGTRNRRNSDWFFESLRDPGYETFQGLLTDEEGDPLAFVVNPKGTSLAHFAAYPPKLIEPMILSCTSERGCCSQCGAPWEREEGEDREISTGGSARKHCEVRDGQGVNGTLRTGNFMTYKTLGWRAGCECVEYTCVTCGFVLDQNHVNTNILSDLLQAPPTKNEEKDVLQSPVLQRASSSNKDAGGNMRAVPEEVPSEEPQGSILQQDVLKQVDGAPPINIQGASENKEGVHPGMGGSASEEERVGLRDGASAGHGEKTGSYIEAKRSSSPQKQGERRQSGGKPDSRKQKAARQEVKRGLFYEVSKMRGKVSCQGKCPRCDGLIEARPAHQVPSTILDPFSGISTTGMVATALGRHSILCDINEHYMAIAGSRDSQAALSLL